MCQIECKGCQETIWDDEDVFEILSGFVEEGEFTPEQEIAYFHPACYTQHDPFSINPAE